jgi:CBS domain-containing protein
VYLRGGQLVNIGEVCSREVYILRPAEPLAEAVAEMHKRHVGGVVVVEGKPDRVRPIGIVTDRDAIRT